MSSDTTFFFSIYSLVPTHEIQLLCVHLSIHCYDNTICRKSTCLVDCDACMHALSALSLQIRLQNTRLHKFIHLRIINSADVSSSDGLINWNHIGHVYSYISYMNLKCMQA